METTLFVLISVLFRDFREFKKKITKLRTHEKIIVKFNNLISNLHNQKMNQ